MEHAANNTGLQNFKEQPRLEQLEHQEAPVLQDVAPIPTEKQ